METTLVAPYPVPPNEQDRLAALYALDILDSDAEPAFDRIVNMAARLMNAPVALVSLVDHDRQWFKAKCGVDVSETARDFSFCTHAMLGSETMVVCDATKDPRFCRNPLVTGEMSIRFYAGAPLRTSEGLGLGSLCVIDTAARQRPAPAQLENLEDLAYLVSRQMELRLTEKARRVNEARLNEAQRIAHVGHWEWDIQSQSGICSDESYRLFGLPPQSGIDLERFQSLLLPEDRERVRQAVSNCLRTGEPYAITHRIVRPNGSVVHVEARGRLERGKMAGTILDVTARVQADLLLRQSKHELEKRAAQRTELLEREIEGHKQTQALVTGQNQVLRKIAEGAPAEQIFEMLLRFGKEEDDLACRRAIFLKTEDGHKLRWVTRPSLPDDAREAFREIEIAPGGASSAEAAYYGRRVILSTPEEMNRADVAVLKHHLGVRSFVSTPILDSHDNVLGTVSFGCPGEYPTSYELRVQDACASLASVVLLRDREQLERKQAEGERQEALSKAQVLADLVPQMFFTTRADGYVDYYNEKWTSYTGKTSEETQGWNWETVVHPDDFEAASTSWARAVRSGEPYQIEARLRRASDGMYRWFLGRALPFRNTSGEVVKWFGTLTDIHDQKTENERLEAVVEARTEQLRRLLTEKETLLKEVHHRVKNNLQIISSLLRMHGDRVRDPAAAAALADSRRRVISMALIHEQLYGNQQMNAINFGEYALTLTNELFSSCSWEGRKISSRVEAANVLLRIDQAIPCGLILNELVTNALKYAYPCGTGAEGGGEVLIELKKAGKEVSLSVSDAGVGLPPGWKLDNKRSLGLPIVDMLAKQLGGQLTLEQGPGARFTVTFPDDNG